MRKRRWIPALCLTLLLQGCGIWSGGSYLSVTPHEEAYNQTQPPEAVKAVTYLELRSAVVDLVENTVTEGMIDVSAYDGDLEQDLSRSIQYATESMPIGAYAVSDVNYSFRRIGVRDMAEISLTFRHTAAEMQAVVSVDGITGAQAQIAKALESFSHTVTMQVSPYEKSDLTDWIFQYCREHPEIVMELPGVSVEVYPKNGRIRVVEVTLVYQHSREELRNMQRAVSTIFSSAAGYVQYGTDDAMKADQLHSFLMERFDYEQVRTDTPSYSLLCQGLGDSEAFARVFSALCRQVGLDCITVEGTRDGEPWFWNILCLDDVHYHVDLMADRDTGSLICRDDGQMSGYDWDQSLYPACGDFAPEPGSEDGEPDTDG